jgi:hypothetical protein
MKLSILTLLLLSLLAGTVCAQATTDTGVLLEAYTQFVLASEVQSQALQMAKPLPEAEAKQIAEQASDWMTSQSEQLRAGLDQQFGDQARVQFSDFVAEYTTAEQNQDPLFLSQLAASLQLVPTPTDYAALRRAVMDQQLSIPFREASRLLGEMQTWAEIRALSPKTPPLSAWLTREKKTVAPTPAAPLAAPAKPVNPLMAAEASAPEWTAPATPPAANPMDAFAQSRQAERAQALSDAQAGMQQMAMERQSAETEYAAKKMAAAQADADAMRAQALKLAAVEQEAIDQRANSWSGRLKKIVSATVGAATGAFTGGIGAEAGRQAAEALFPR